MWRRSLSEFHSLKNRERAIAEQANAISAATKGAGKEAKLSYRGHLVMENSKWVSGGTRSIAGKPVAVGADQFHSARS
jgi:hypothetical protein